MIERYAAVNHQTVSNSVFEHEIMPLEICVAVPAVAVVEPVCGFDRSFFDSLKNKRLVNVILTMSMSGSSA
jgi:hypothetical protein